MRNREFSASSLKRKILRLLVGILIALTLFVFVLMRDDKDRQYNILTPVWRGIIPGRTTEWEVRSILGKPNMIILCPYWPSLRDPYRSGSLRDLPVCFSTTWSYVYEEERVTGKPPAKHEIRFRFATVLAIVESEWLSPNESSPQLLKKFILDYGQPERVTWARQFSYYRAFLFCEHGIMVLANDEYVGQIIYFVPMPVSDCVREFEYDISTKDPLAGTSLPSVENPWPWLIDDK